MYGYGYRYSARPNVLAFNPLTDIDGLSLYLNKNTNVNTKVAADFVAANSEHLSSASTDFQPTDSDFSITTWVNLDSLTGSVCGVGGLATELCYIIYNNGTTMESRISLNGTSWVTASDTSTTIAIDTWYLVAFVYDSVNDLIKVSVNGNNFNVAIAGGGVGGTYTNDFSLGSNGATSYIDGSIDATNFFNKALTLAEIKALYNSGNGVDYPSLTDLNGTQYAIGQLLDGSTDAFNIDSVLTPLASTTTGEIEMYVTPVDATPIGVERLVSFAETATTDDYITIEIRTDGKLRAQGRINGINQWQLETDVAAFSNGVQAKINLIQDGVSPVLKVNDVEVAQSFLVSTDKTIWLNDTVVDNGRIGNLLTSSGSSAFFNGTIQNVKIWSDDTQTTLVANWLMNDVEGANQTDSEGTYDATLIGTPVSTLASVNNTTIATIESSLVDWWRLNETSGNRSGELGHTLTDNNTVGYALGKVQEVTETGELVWNWIDQSSNAYVFQQNTVTVQPFLDTNNLDFSGGTDLLEYSSSPFSADTSGIIFISGYYVTGSQNRLFSSANTAVTNNYFDIEMRTGGVLAINFHNGTSTIATSTDTVADGEYYYGYIKSNGTEWEINLNGVVQTLIISGGDATNHGSWIGDVPSTDNLAIGGVITSSPFYGDAKSNKIIYSTDHTINTTPVLNFMSDPNN